MDLILQSDLLQIICLLLITSILTALIMWLSGRGRFKRLKKEHQALEKDHHALLNTNNELTASQDNLTNKLSLSIQEKDDTYAQLTKAQEELYSFESKMRNAGRNSDSLQAQLEARDEQIKDLLNDLKNIGDRTQNLTASGKEKDATIKNLESNISFLNSQIESLNGQMADSGVTHGQELEDLKAKIGELETKLADKTSIIGQKNEVLAAYGDFDAREADLQSRIGELQSVNKKLNVTLNDLKTSHQFTKTELAGLQQQLAAASAPSTSVDASDLTQKIKNLEAHNYHLSINLDDSERRNSEYQAEISRLVALQREENVLVAASNGAVVETANVDKVAIDTSVLDAAKEEAAGLQKEVDQLSKKLSSLTNKNKDLVKQLKEATKEGTPPTIPAGDNKEGLKKLEEELAAAKKSLKSAKTASTKQLKEANAKLVDVEKTVQSLTNEKQALSTHLEKVQADLEKLRKTAVSTGEGKQTDTNKEISIMNEKLTADLNAWKDKYLSLEKSHTSLNKDLKTAQKELKTAQAKKSDLKHIEDLAKKSTILADEKAKLQERIAELSVFKGKYEDMTKTESTLQQKLDTTSKELSNATKVLQKAQEAQKKAEAKAKELTSQVSLLAKDNADFEKGQAKIKQELEMVNNFKLLHDTLQKDRNLGDEFRNLLARAAGTTEKVANKDTKKTTETKKVANKDTKKTTETKKVANKDTKKTTETKKVANKDNVVKQQARKVEQQKTEVKNTTVKTNTKQPKIEANPKEEQKPSIVQQVVKKAGDELTKKKEQTKDMLSDASNKLDASIKKVGGKVEEKVEKINPRQVLFRNERGEQDDLSRIKGVEKSTETLLNGMGLYSFYQMARLSPDDVDNIAGVIGVDAEQINKQKWVKQAKKFFINKVR